MHKFSILNLLLVVGLFCTTFAWLYERNQMADNLEKEIEAVHFGWGTVRSADGRIKMARISLDAGRNLEKGHKLNLFYSLNELIWYEEFVNGYVGMKDPNRAIAYGSKILALLNVSSAADFELQLSEVYGDLRSFHFDEDTGAISSDAMQFVEASIQFRDAAQENRMQ